MEEEATNEAEEAMKAAMAAQKKSEAVAAQKASEAVKKNSIKDLLYNSTDFPLAKPGNDHLRDIVRTTGFKAIDALASVVLSIFENSGRGVKLQGAETARLTAVIGLSKTVTDVLEWNEFPDVAAFVSEIVRHIKSNAILVGAAAVWWERRRADDIQLTTKEREELRLSVLWCFLMHAVCKKAIFQPMDSENCIYQQIVTDFAEKRKEGAAVWEKYGFDFEKMKVLGVDGAVKRYLDAKLGRAQSDNKGGKGMLLSVNIMMAMYSDVKKGNDDNAKAGFELMVESRDQDPIKGLNNKIDYEYVHDGVPLGVTAATPPLPKVWANLYTSWNMAFVADMAPCAPLMLAKLLAPVVLGTYQEIDPGLFMLTRVVCLYMAFQFGYIAITQTGYNDQTLTADGKLAPHSDWRIKLREACKVMGEVNALAGKQFYKRVDKIVDDNYDVGVEVFRDIQRASATAAWETLKGMIKAFSKARKQNINKNSEHAADATPASADEVAFIKTLGLRYPELMNPKD